MGYVVFLIALGMFFIYDVLKGWTVPPEYKSTEFMEDLCVLVNDDGEYLMAMIHIDGLKVWTTKDVELAMLFNIDRKPLNEAMQILSANQYYFKQENL